MGLLRFIIVFLLISWIIRVIFRLLAPSILRNMTSKAQQQYQQTPRPEEGSVHIDYIPPHPKNTRDPGGDFVDFEEVKS